MDYGTYRGIYTLILLVLFLVIVYWAYSKKQKSKFDDIVNSIFEDDVNETPRKKESSNDND
jgi:cytochrome c oxidase cbb3-type subunit 4